MPGPGFNGGVPPFVLPPTGAAKVPKRVMGPHGFEVDAWDGAAVELKSDLMARGAKAVADKMKAAKYKEKRPPGYIGRAPIGPGGAPG